MVSDDPLPGRSRHDQFLPEAHGRTGSPASVKTSLKPRNREVTSRYKSPAPSSSASAPLAASRRFVSPSSAHVPDVASPRRSASAERRRPSSTRSADTRIPDGSVDGALLSRCSSARSELLWPSSRNMFASMQGESFASARSKSPANARLDSRGKSTSLASDHTLRPSANVAQRHTDQRKGTPDRKGTPLRRQSLEQVENARPAENLHPKPQQHRWAGSSTGKVHGAAMSRSVDLTGDKERQTSRALSGSMQGKSTLTTVVRAPRLTANSRVFSQSINEGSISSVFNTGARKPTLETRARIRESPITPRRGTRVKDANTASPQLDQSIHPVRQSGEEETELANAALSDATADMYAATSSVGATVATSVSRGIPGNGTVTKVARRGAAPARSLQDATGRSRNSSDIGRLRSSTLESEYSVVAGGKLGSRQRLALSSETKVGHGLTASPPWSRLPQHLALAFKSSQQPLSPVRVPANSPLRSLPSPTRHRASTLSSPARSFTGNRSGGAAVMLNFGVEARKGKKALTQAEEAFLHRILHNRVLQWCFVNARAEFATNAQTLLAEKLLFSVWTKTAELRKSVTTKRIKLQQARQTHKLSSILRAQVLKLEDWSSVQQEHGNALIGAVGALEACVLRVPVNEGVRADTQEVKEAVDSAMDVVNTLQSSITNLLPKLEKTNKLASDLAQVAAQERTLLEECGDLLLIASTLEVEEYSLRTHLVQFEQERARVLGHLIGNGVTGSSSVLVSSS